jgi:glyceraldehyde 3-phosphate dehydrogenase
MPQRPEPDRLPWRELGVDLVVESTGRFRSRDQAAAHLRAGDQRLLDAPHQDLRRARSAALNIIPTTTGAARTMSLVIPETAGLLDGVAVRVPVPTGSLVDLATVLRRPASAEQITQAQDDLVKVFRWYDSEWGYCTRLADLAAASALDSAGG